MMQQHVFAFSLALALGVSAAALAAESSVLFVLDGSGSMQAKVDGRPKIEVARTVMSRLIQSLPGEVRVGLATFGHTRKDDCSDIEVLVPVGTDRTAFIKAVNTLTPKGKTPLTGAIQLAATQFREYEGAAQVVVVSDGKETCEGDPCAAVRDALAAGVRMQVHVVGFDVTKEEAEQLTCIAQAGNGKYFPAANAAELGKAFAQVKQEVAPSPPSAQPKPPAVAAGSGVFFRDDFEGTVVNPAWKIVREDVNRWTLEDGKLVIITQHGQIAEDTIKNWFILNRQLPANYTITAKLNITLLSPGNFAGLGLYLDNDNGLLLSYRGVKELLTFTRQPFFSKRIQGQSNILKFFQEGRGIEKEHENIWLRLEKRGSNFTASFSNNGTKWNKIGEHTMLRMDNAQVSLAASNSMNGGAEVTARFDWIEIR